MKLRNKKTGEIIEAESCNNASGCISIYYEEYDGQIGTKDCYTSLAELNEEWEDYEEPKGYWYMSNRGDIRYIDDEDTDWDNERKQIGNHFETEEEAEKAVEKLKAWKRCGISFEGWEYTNVEGVIDGVNIKIKAMDFNLRSKKADLDLLFGGEE